MSDAPQKSLLDSLPKQFVLALRALFDILDEDKLGYIKLSDIESRWDGSRVEGLPVGVKDALRKVSTHDGSLSFDRFVGAIKIALIRSKKLNDKCEEKGRSKHDICSTSGSKTRPSNFNVDQDPVTELEMPRPVSPGSGSVPTSGLMLSAKPDLVCHTFHPSENRPTSNNNRPVSKAYYGRIGRPASISVPVSGLNKNYVETDLVSSNMHTEGKRRRQTKQVTAPFERQILNHPSTVAVKPNNAIAQHRTNSMPHLPQDGEEISDLNRDVEHNRYGKKTTTSAENSAPLVLRDNIGKERYRNFKNDQEDKEIYLKQNRDVRTGNRRPLVTIVSSLQYFGYSFMASRKEMGDDAMFDGKVSPIKNQGDFERGASGNGGGQTAASRRKEPRRHTLSNGVDYSMVKRMKQLEQEKDILLQGLQAVQRATDWYQQQLQDVHHKQKCIARSPPHYDQSLETYQERLNLQTTRILDLNLQVKALIDSSEKGFLSQTSQAGTQAVSLRLGDSQHRDSTITKLRSQNKMLTQEVSEKCDKIGQLEEEKSQLVRQLFETRGKNRTANYDDTTFI